MKKKNPQQNTMCDGKMRFVPQSFIHCESDGDRLLPFIYIKFFFHTKNRGHVQSKYGQAHEGEKV